MTTRISRTIAGFGIGIAAAASIVLSAGIASASPLDATGGAPTVMQVCTPWLIEHAQPCIPNPYSPVHRHRHAHEAGHSHGPCHHHH